MGHYSQGFLLILPNSALLQRPWLLLALWPRCFPRAVTYPPNASEYHRIVESLRLEKIIKIIQSNRQTTITSPQCHIYPFLENLQGIMIPPLHWETFQYLTTISEKNFFLIFLLALQSRKEAAKQSCYHKEGSTPWACIQRSSTHRHSLSQPHMFSHQTSITWHESPEKWLV